MYKMKEEEKKYTFYPTGREWLAKKNKQVWVGQLHSLFNHYPVAIIVKTEKI